MVLERVSDEILSTFLHYTWKKQVRVPVFYSPKHQFHNPIYEYDRGIQVPYQEIPRRIEVTRKALQNLSCTEVIEPETVLPLDQILRIHSQELVEHLQKQSKLAGLQGSGLEQEERYLYPWIYPLNPQMAAKLKSSPEAAGCYAFDTYAPIGANTWQAVYTSANLAASAAYAVVEDEARIVYALCRPPGHHAGCEMFGGYCYLNNAAIAADILQQSLSRGAILDIDYHHGNGTQEIFWSNSEVMFVSIHADPADEYPFFSGFRDEQGGGQAIGTNLNLPLPKGTGGSAYLTTLDSALNAILEFRPNWLVLSAGYDTCVADPSTFFELTDETYSEIGKRIGGLNLPTVIVHEGGYAVEQNGALAVRLLSGIIDSSG